MRVGTPRRNGRTMNGAHRAHGVPSVIQAEAVVHGRLDSTGELHVHGVVAGDILAPKVTLWHDAYVEGNVLAEEAVIHGHFNGRAIARTVIVGATAIIEGQVFHHTIDMARGSHVNARFPWRPVNFFEEYDQQLQQPQ